jgi:hypothetical protein
LANVFEYPLRPMAVRPAVIQEPRINGPRIWRLSLSGYQIITGTKSILKADFGCATTWLNPPWRGKRKQLK